MGSMKVKSHVNTAGGGIKYATNGLRKNFEGGTLSEQVLSTSRRDRPDAIRYDRCKVVVTIGGPLTETVEQLEAMLRAGMTVARFDFTAGSRSLDQHLNTLKNLRLAQKNTQCLCAVHCALGGNLFATATKAREDTRLVFAEGQTVRFVHRVESAGEREKSDTTTARTTAFENTDVIPVGGGEDLEKLDFLGSFRVGDAVRVRPFLRAGETSAALEVTAVDAREVTCRCLRGAEMAHAVKRLAVDLAHTGGSRRAARRRRVSATTRTRWYLPTTNVFERRAGATTRLVQPRIRAKHRTRGRSRSTRPTRPCSRGSRGSAGATLSPCAACRARRR